MCGPDAVFRHEYHEKSAASIDDIVSILSCVLDNIINPDTVLANEGIKCCQVFSHAYLGSVVTNILYHSHGSCMHRGLGSEMISIFHGSSI